MSNTTASLGRQIDSAVELQSVVRTMKALAASSIGQYEQAVRALADYADSVELGLSVCIRSAAAAHLITADSATPVEGAIGALVFGSDQGLVGQFNDVVADHAGEALAGLSPPPMIWAVGERVQARLADAGLSLTGSFAVPQSVTGITALVANILMASEAHISAGDIGGLYLFYNQLSPEGGYGPVSHRVLPLDGCWRRKLAERTWPTDKLPEVIGTSTATLQALIREYLFVSLFRACAESLASENASRLAAMQRADSNIDQLLEEFRVTFHRVRQAEIDEELFDVIAGFEALPREF
ncbi:F0F1 ATP synthase subunit gamma [Oceanisphaera arctica]|uniref:F0F1 ATP synthase subunit gamma n=1 Tax=Oceanisphaera arctica TaxID=641510 RepID=A0A2P5TM20_9GAMM|nr:F0F1 ATP synthase subunit gamma [Oceanisphaera arctica]PPL16438.1 F0F1 ATP synthase subunit gamma [Oceanisphaera arctica]GHA03612.1 F0F1 ATP synthase subunit gamma [Oceanisphaera arctica]